MEEGIAERLFVAAEYFNRKDVDDPFNVKSASKGFLSALTGIALAEGRFDRLESTEFSPHARLLRRS